MRNRSRGWSFDPDPGSEVRPGARRAWTYAPVALVVAFGAAGQTLATPLLAAREEPQDALQNSAQEEPSSDAFADAVWPLVERYCGDCHSGPEPEAALDLLAFETLDAVHADTFTWETVRERIQAREMPPRVLPQPTEDERAVLLTWLDATLGASVPAEEQPGRTVLRRLNRFEVQNALLDVLGVRLDASDYLPLDEAAAGFDTIGSALSFTDAHLEGLFALAEEAARRAVPWVDPELGEERAFAPADFEVEPRFLREDMLRFFTNGEATTHVEAARAGTYELTVFAGASRGGDEPARLRVGLDGEEVALVDVTHPEDGFAPYALRLELEPGTHRIALAFVNDYYEPEHPDPRLRDRNLFLERMTLAGPPGDAQGGEDGLAARAEADLAGTLGELVESLWRRPPSPGDLERLLALAPREAPAPLALRAGLVGSLVSPRFLFRLERDPLGAERRALDGYELATRLAGFLWSSVPDAALRARAQDGTLTDPDVLAAETRRLLNDARASRMVEGFASQWLQLRPLRTAAPDPKRFAAYDDALREAMLAETRLLFEALLREPRPLADLVDPDFTFLNARLAEHYGIPGVEGDLMRRVPLVDRRRGGLLSQASVLTATSFPTRTSPVLRGKWVLEVLLGDAPPPPPPDIPALPAAAEDGDPTDLRAALEAHRADPACSACHAAMDPLGFGLEPYDAIGGWRARAQDLDASGVLPDGRTFQGPVELKRILRDDPRFPRNVTGQLLTYALGRALAPADRLLADRIADGLRPGRDSLGDLIEGVVRSDSFRTRVADPAAPVQGQ